MYKTTIIYISSNLATMSHAARKTDVILYEETDRVRGRWEMRVGGVRVREEGEENKFGKRGGREIFLSTKRTAPRRE